MARLNITLPDDIAQKLAEKPNKSRFIAMVLKDEFNREIKKKTDRLMKEGFQATCKEDNNLNDEWEKASLEKWE